MIEQFSAPVEGGSLGGSRSGAGPAVLVLHGGPGSSDYTEGLEAEIAGRCTLVRYTQRGVEPSLERGPYTVEQHVADAIAVLDALGLERAWLLGHSWGGHLAMHVAVTHPERLHGLISVSALGAVGDGGEAGFAAELMARTPPADAARAEELDQRAMRGEGTDAEAMESLRLLWPAYFHTREAAPEMPESRLSVECYADTWASMHEHLAAGTLERGLPGLSMPALIVHGRQDPIPLRTAREAAELIPGARLEVIDECGHFPWLEQPGVLGDLVAGFTAG